MKEVKINGRMVPINLITEVFVEGTKWMINIYGESDEQITDRFVIDEIIEAAPHVVDKDIIETRKNSPDFFSWLSN